MRTSSSKRIHHALTVIAVVIGLIGLTALGWYLHSTRPDYYQPERSALVLAKQRLYASFGEETDLLERIQEMHRDMQAAIEILEQLDDLNRLQNTSREELQRIFTDLEIKLNQLIEKVEAQTSK
ncbi:MAG: hypothetical protein ABW095_04070 [Candidatus Thiodiazotropha sp.]